MSADRFVLLQPGETRPTGVPLPPGFGVEDRFMEDLFAAGPAVRTAEGAMDLKKVHVIGERYGMRYAEGTMTLDQVVDSPSESDREVDGQRPEATAGSRRAS